MNPNEQYRLLPELQSLLSDLIDGKMSDQDRQKLRDILRGNPEVQDEYRNFMALHTLLHIDLGQGELQLLPPVVRSRSSIPPALGASAWHEYGEDRPSAVSCGCPPQNDEPMAGRGWLTKMSNRRKWRAAGIIGALAASILLVVLNYRLTQPVVTHVDAPSIAKATSLEQKPEVVDAETLATNETRHVAVLGQSSRASWSIPQSPLDMGASLAAGRFELKEGLVQIEFLSGATVIIQAPADFELISANRIACDLGKIRAHVPSQAKGFTITTPTHSAVDLGTEFTVRVEGTGESFFQVLDGEVELWDGRRADSILTQTLTAGQGVRSTAAGDLVEMIAPESSFVGSKQMLEMAAAARRERYDDWRRFSQEIRSAPNVILYYGFDGHSPWERILRNDRPDSSEMLDGAIVGGQWTIGRWKGKKALEFKRTSDRVRINVPGEFESLTFAAWLRIEGLERWLSSLMLTDGHEPGEVHWQMTDLGQFMLGVKAEPDRSHDFYSPSVIGPTDLGRWVHVACVYNGKEGYVSHLVDGAEVSREAVRIPTKLRIGAAEIGNWVPQDLSDYRIRSLNGRVDEFILLDRPLTTKEIGEIYEAGRPQS